jgi:hypothetical protein
MAVEDAAAEEVVIVLDVVVVRVVVCIRGVVVVVVVVVVGEETRVVEGREEEEEEEKVVEVLLLSSGVAVVAARHERLVEAAFGVVVTALEVVVAVEESAEVVVAMYHFARVLRASEDVVAVVSGAVLVVVVDAAAAYHTIAVAGEESAAKHSARKERRRAAMTGRGEAGRDQEVVRWLRLADDTMGARRKEEVEQQTVASENFFGLRRVDDENCRRRQSKHRSRLVQRVHSRQRRFSNASAIVKRQERCFPFFQVGRRRRELALPSTIFLLSSAPGVEVGRWLTPRSYGAEARALARREERKKSDRRFAFFFCVAA